MSDRRSGITPMLLLVLLSASSAPAWAGPTTVLTHPVETAVSQGVTAPTHDRGAAAAVCALTPLTWHGQANPGGSGTLAPMGFARSTGINNLGHVAFMAAVTGADRNQGIFIEDGAGLRPLVMGCGGNGGSGATAACGDPAPGGGMFSGLHSGVFATPDINDAGDVLFLADPHDGGTIRGLYLYRKSEDDFVRLAAIGDSVGSGRTITEIGHGAINNHGTAVFLATLDGADQSDILIWRQGQLDLYAAYGDPAPGGGTFIQFGTEFWGLADGTRLPGGPAPTINDDEVIAFRATVYEDEATLGLFVSQAGEHAWWVRMGDEAPGGGTYGGFGAPALNHNGQIAFYADLNGGPGAAWVVGRPGEWRRALAWFDELPEGKVWSLPISRNPIASLADNGDLILGSALLQPDQTEKMSVVLSRNDGEQRLLLLQGQAIPGGGTWNNFDSWPSVNSRMQARIGAGHSGVPGVGVNGQWLADLCTDAEPGLTSLPDVGDSLDLGDVFVGGAAASAGIDVGNDAAIGTGVDGDLRILHASTDHPAVTVTIQQRGPFAAGSAPDGEADLLVSCQPTAVGVINAELTVLTNDRSQPDDGFRYPVLCQGVDDRLFQNGFEN